MEIARAAAAAAGSATKRIEIIEGVINALAQAYCRSGMPRGSLERGLTRARRRERVQTVGSSHRRAWTTPEQPIVKTERARSRLVVIDQGETTSSCALRNC